MNVKKTLAASTAALVLIGSALPASAAGIDASYVKALKENGTADLILNVDAYRAAYPDLDAAFGDDTNAYIMHYLTAGMYEGRTMGVLFNPLAYAEAYSDIKEAFGDDISAVVNHYVTFGIAENRTAGTAGAYTDLAEAQRETAAGAPVDVGNPAGEHITCIYNNGVLVRREFYDANNRLFQYSVVTDYNGAANSYTETVYSSSNVLVRVDKYVNGVRVSTTDSGTSTGSGTTTGGNTTTSGSTTTGNSSTTPSTGHITEIKGDDGTVIRREFYDANDRLFQYSEITDRDSAANSYTESIYSIDNVLIRVDRYVNGVLQ
ncbi:MAG: hypothetical protein HDR08_17680 [Lachnospiraceae bacterium]|nr:hypothetical protein [Lachnospiraceae bacterium]